MPWVLGEKARHDETMLGPDRQSWGRLRRRRTTSSTPRSPIDIPIRPCFVARPATPQPHPLPDAAVFELVGPISSLSPVGFVVGPPTLASITFARPSLAALS